MFSQMLFLLVKKMEILFSVPFCPLKSITNSYDFAHSTFLAFVLGNYRWVGGNFIPVRKAKEATSERNEELQRRGVLLDRISS